MNSLSSHANEQLGPLGPKAAGLLDLVKWDIPTPPAVFLWPDECGNIDDAIDLLASEVGRPLGSVENDRPFAVTVRFESKRMYSDLPPTFVALAGGAAYEELISSRLREICLYISKAERLSDLGPREQVTSAIKLAMKYLARKECYLPIIVQQMVFGSGPNSCSGMAYTRHPKTGQRTPYGRYRLAVEGFQYAASSETEKTDLVQLHEDLPVPASRLQEFFDRIHQNTGEPRYVEFIVQSNTVFIVQCTRGNN